MLAKMQLEDIRKESIFNLNFDCIPFQAKTSLQLEIFIKKDTHYEQPASRSTVYYQNSIISKMRQLYQILCICVNHNQVKNSKIKFHLVLTADEREKCLSFPLGWFIAYKKKKK
jgi:hypothetical protein